MARRTNLNPGRTLRELRRATGMSQARFAFKSGVSASLVDQVERGQKTLGIEAATKAARVLHTDAFSLYLATNIAAMKSQVESGSEGPLKPAGLARRLLEMIESGELSPAQRKAARDAVEKLVKLVEDAAAQKRSTRDPLQSLGYASLPQGPSPGPSPQHPVDPPTRDVEDSAQRFTPPGESYSDQQAKMASLGRDIHGRKKPPKRGADAVDIDLDSIPESGEYAAKGVDEEKSRMDELGRDSFGRRRP